MASFDRIQSNYNVLNGEPNIRGLCVSVRRVLEAIAQHEKWDEVLKECPQLEAEDIRQALKFAARRLWF